MWGHFQRRRQARREGSAEVAWLGLLDRGAVGVKKPVILGVSGGRKGAMPLMFQE